MNILLAQQNGKPSQGGAETVEWSATGYIPMVNGSEHTGLTHIDTRRLSSGSHPPRGSRLGFPVCGTGPAGGKLQRRGRDSGADCGSRPWSCSKSELARSIARSLSKSRWRLNQESTTNFPQRTWGPDWFSTANRLVSRCSDGLVKRTLTIDESAAIPKIKFNCAITWPLRCRDSGFARYCS